MNFINQWMQSDWVKALGWTFVHSLWQIAIVGVLLFIILRLIPGRSAHMRYTLATLALWMIVIMGLSTFLIMLPNETSLPAAAGNAIIISAEQSLSITEKISLWVESNMPMMLTVWLGGVLLLLTRLLLSLGWVGHMRSTAIAAHDLQQSLDDILLRLHLKIKPVVSESNYVTSPVTIGHLKPLILFPIGIINQLTPAEVEAVLTHELAHIVRRDYLSNLIQSFIETLFYYHPVTWWISRVVRTERENRADDLAISWCGDHLGYAKALMTVQEMQTGYQPTLAIGFASRKGAMLARIQRILHIPYKNHNQMEKTVLLSLCSLCFLAFTITGNAKNDHAGRKENTFNDLLSLVELNKDTIPSKGIYRIHKKTDDQDINIEVENGAIKQLKIDGMEIQPSEYAEYNDIIDELFGEMNAAPTPPAVYGYGFGTPPVPGFPELPVLPAMPPMDVMEFEHFYGNGSNFAIMDGQKVKILCDTMKFFNDAGGEMIKSYIVINGDSSIIMTPGADFYKSMPAIEMEEFMKHSEDWKNHQKEWSEHMEEWQKNSEEWQKNLREHSGQLQLELRSHENELRSHEDQMKAKQKQIEKSQNREILRHHGYGEGGSGEARVYNLEEMLQAEGLGHARAYVRTSRPNMTESLIADGLIEPGEEAEIQLTPDKLKINGKKMDAETHKKYLKMYESQQGVELSGNSRIEFKTKSRRSM